VRGRPPAGESRRIPGLRAGENRFFENQIFERTLPGPLPEGAAFPANGLLGSRGPFFTEPPRSLPGLFVHFNQDQSSPKVSLYK